VSRASDPSPSSTQGHCRSKMAVRDIVPYFYLESMFVRVGASSFSLSCQDILTGVFGYQCVCACVCVCVCVVCACAVCVCACVCVCGATHPLSRTILTGVCLWGRQCLRTALMLQGVNRLNRTQLALSFFSSTFFFFLFLCFVLFLFPLSLLSSPSYNYCYCYCYSYSYSYYYYYYHHSGGLLILIIIIITILEVSLRVRLTA
jgi:hypothetical protein